MLKLWRQGDPQDFVASSQDKPFQEGMKDVGPIAHQTDILGRDERRRDDVPRITKVSYRYSEPSLIQPQRHQTTAR